MPTQHLRTSELAARWLDRKAQNPRERAVDAARALGVSEAELLASRCGEGVTRVRGEWGTLLADLGQIGEVMALTRNPTVVIETDGRYRNVEDFGAMGQVLDEGIDLRLFLARWSAGFVVREHEALGLKPSIHFFDSAGTAVHKVFLRPGSDRQALERVADRWKAEDQSPEQTVAAGPAAETELPDSDIDVPALRASWEAMQDTHDFFRILREYRVARTQALRLIGRDLAYPVAVDSLQRTIERLRDAQLPFMTFVGNHGCIQIHTGEARRIVKIPDWFNVMDPTFNLHVHEPGIRSAWVVRKPTSDGIVTALEVYDDRNEQVALLCGKRKPGNPESLDWRGIVEELASLDA